MKLSRHLNLVLGTGLLALSAWSAQATVVEVQTVMGNFKVNLYDSKTPKTVENFLGYVKSGAYFNNVVHRSMDDFIIQAGGYQFDGELPLNTLSKGPSVVNEPKLSNVRGTIAMAKQANDPDSATSEWFINLEDNSANLDLQNHGFTVFGQVLGDGMQVVDAIAALPTFNKGAGFRNMPLRHYSDADADIAGENLVLITDIVVVDAAINTHPELNPVPNTLINQLPTSESSSSGGSLSWGVLLAGMLVALRRRFSLKS
ncbi:peptidylprolyl isomerase [Bowmanella pacifica]|uniref:Peptidyl-prolyl cis-trans isomerase n=1 Tax=Bowmanella pacifica TaxID=502051 RepID=A0A918DGZ2_9ALTE|nr:peptidylprolyl isomerase [Bowmanella pacifica]GGO64610.1 hypothetical protein GCM10010982_04450 [Bowmanella pacifica]